MRMLQVEGLSKSFTLHLQGGLVLPVFDNISLSLDAGECVVLAGPSGIGKSTLLRLIYGNYKALSGAIRVEHRGSAVDIANSAANVIGQVRAESMGYVSQFLRCLPRVAAIDVVADPLLTLGVDPAVAHEKAAMLLSRLDISERLFDLPPATFSGGEQQRVNIARGFMHDYRLLLLDEPTASLDEVNRSVVIELINEAKSRGAALLGIFHDADVRRAVADRIFDVETIRTAA